MPRTPPSNNDLAYLLERIADLLDAKGENPFRVRSYRTAAASLRNARQQVSGIIAAKGAAGLLEIKGIGERIAGLISEYIEAGHVELLENLEKETTPDQKKEAGRKKKPAPAEQRVDIPLALLLDIDAEYRGKAAGGKLKRIAPRKLNPEGKAWLPILNTERKGYRFTVMFSNTERAHELGKTNDWVVVYYEKGRGENQCTVVTEQRGALKGKRVVRGREQESQEYYRKHPS